jgi:hypothetical protein
MIWLTKQPVRDNVSGRPEPVGFPFSWPPTWCKLERMRPLIMLLCFAGIIFAQQQAVQTVADPLLWGAVFGQVEIENTAARMLAQNPDMARKLAEAQAAHPGVRLLPSIRVDAGLTDREWETISKVAADFNIGFDAILKEVPRRELVLHHVEGSISPELAKQVLGLEKRRLDMIADSVRRIHEALGDQRFEALNAYVQRIAKILHPLEPLLDPDLTIRY